jgi:hypothetical protein
VAFFRAVPHPSSLVLIHVDVRCLIVVKHTDSLVVPSLGGVVSQFGETLGYCGKVGKDEVSLFHDALREGRRVGKRNATS